MALFGTNIPAIKTSVVKFSSAAGHNVQQVIRPYYANAYKNSAIPTSRGCTIALELRLRKQNANEAQARTVRVGNSYYYFIIIRHCSRKTTITVTDPSCRLHGRS